MRTHLTWRACLLGLLLGLLISAATYYNDQVIRQSFLVLHLLPVSVLGVLLTMALANPLLRAVKIQPLTSGELAIVAALGLVASSLPDAGFWRTFTACVAMPSQLQKTRPSWIGAEVMSYVPGASAALGAGHVRDWHELSRRIAPGPSQDPTGQAIWEAMSSPHQAATSDLAQRDAPEGEAVRQFQRALNQAMSSPTVAAAWGASDEASAEARMRQVRAAMVKAWPDLVLPAPRGGGVLLADGRPDDPVLDAVLSKQPGSAATGWRSIAWARWWPVLRTWGLTALLLAGASLCLAMLVHPQWAQRELLAYPIPRFVAEMLTTAPGGAVPLVLRQRMFWLGCGLTFAIGLLNGLNAWFPSVPHVNLELNFSAAAQLLPHASRVAEIHAYLSPWIFLPVIAFAWFLPGQISLSLGLAPLCYVILGSLLIVRGQTLGAEYLGADNANLLRFGAYLGMGLIILYTGRSWYLQCAKAAVGLGGETPDRSSAWAVRALALCSAAAVWTLHHAGLDWVLASCAVALMLLTILVIARITAETGMFYIQAYWLPAGVITALWGFDAVGPTGYIMLALASVLLIGDTRTLLMANLVNGLKITQTVADTGPRRLWPWLGTTIVLGFVVAGAATLLIQHREGLQGMDPWSRQMLPEMPFNQLVFQLQACAARGGLFDATAVSGLERWAAIRPDAATWGWAGLGLALTLGLSAARLRLPWWPLHPVLLLVWGTFPSNRYAFSLLLGWAIKLAVVRTAGARGYAAGVPLMVGVIAGTLLAAMLWIVVGLIYYLNTGRSPASYWFS